MKPADQVLKEFSITEKSNILSSNLGQYTFEIYLDADRISVKHAIEKTFNVSVTRVNILNRKGKRKSDRRRRGKFGQKASIKKAIVSLKEGDTIEIV
ncbi:MAG: 50S ribosomal protein L23 [Opitutaceae bacterium]|nr:50S ribosomal protein L23 [Opitutaceae bacterium]|tara:strand:+ start:2371 stop:2661 length:291 start_codon:yes stop_codon:yes gene_type:complete